MSRVVCQMSISLDGFVAGPNQSLANPIGEGGMRLHQWMFETASWREREGEKSGAHTADSDVIDEFFENIGAYIMGRKMFGGGNGPWDLAWRGWWGDDPPYHTPVFVLTHQPREPLAMRGGTTFKFVTDGIQSALEQARSAAGEKDISIAGGASTVQQYLAAGLLDELYLHIVPVILGAGERLLAGVGDPTLELTKVVASPAVTHIKYRIPR
jgi:dihydrofolate reductase